MLFIFFLFAQNKKRHILVHPCDAPINLSMLPHWQNECCSDGMCIFGFAINLATITP